MKKVFNITKIFLPLVTIPLWFIKMFKGVGHLPNKETREIVKVVFRHSMYENICDGNTPLFFYIPIAITVTAAVLNIIAWKSSNKKLTTIGNIVFGIAIGLFVILLLFASTIARGY